jgi:hypothetical protein
MVRTALAQWLTAAEIPGLMRVERGLVQFQVPRFTAGGPLVRATGYVLLDSRGRGREKRIAFGGPTDGRKQIDHLATVVLHFWSPAPSSDDGWLTAQDEFDRIIEDVLAQVRAGGRTLGRPDVILQAAEAPYGMDYQVTEPVGLNGGTIGMVAEVSFQVTEIIAS